MEGGKQDLGATLYDAVIYFGPGFLAIAALGLTAVGLGIYLLAEPGMEIRIYGIRFVKKNNSLWLPRDSYRIKIGNLIGVAMAAMLGVGGTLYVVYPDKKDKKEDQGIAKVTAPPEQDRSQKALHIVDITDAVNRLIIQKPFEDRFTVSKYVWHDRGCSLEVKYKSVVEVAGERRVKECNQHFNIHRLLASHDVESFAFSTVFKGVSLGKNCRTKSSGSLGDMTQFVARFDDADDKKDGLKLMQSIQIPSHCL